MLKRAIALILCLLCCVSVFSACKEETPSDTSSVDSTDTVSSTSDANQSQTDNSKTESEENAVSQSIYGTWVQKVEITELVEKFVAGAYPESVVVVEPVYVDRVLELSKNGKCTETINAGKVFYDAVLNTVKIHIRSLTSDVSTINIRIAEFKKKYKKENVTKNMNSMFTGTFTVRGNPTSSGTITFRGTGLDGQKSFVLEGSIMTTKNIVNGRADETTIRIYEKQITD